MATDKVHQMDAVVGGPMVGRYPMSQAPKNTKPLQLIELQGLIMVHQGGRWSNRNY